MLSFFRLPTIMFKSISNDGTNTFLKRMLYRTDRGPASVEVDDVNNDQTTGSCPGQSSSSIDCYFSFAPTMKHLPWHPTPPLFPLFCKNCCTIMVKHSITSQNLLKYRFLECLGFHHEFQVDYPQLNPVERK